jgi:hypothetical protein
VIGRERGEVWIWSDRKGAWGGVVLGRGLLLATGVVAGQERAEAWAGLGWWGCRLGWLSPDGDLYDG